MYQWSGFCFFKVKSRVVSAAFFCIKWFNHNSLLFCLPSVFFRSCKRSLLHESLNHTLIDKIPGRPTDRKTLLGELNWIFTAVTDTIAWNVLPHGKARFFFLFACMCILYLVQNFYWLFQCYDWCIFNLSDLFQRLFRQDLLVASLFRNFLLAERIMRSANCSPISYPMLPPTHQHHMWYVCKLE